MSKVHYGCDKGEINMCGCVRFEDGSNTIKRERRSKCVWLCLKCIRENGYKI